MMYKGFFLNCKYCVFSTFTSKEIKLVHLTMSLDMFLSHVKIHKCFKYDFNENRRTQSKIKNYLSPVSSIHMHETAWKGYVSCQREIIVRMH